METYDNLCTCTQGLGDDDFKQHAYNTKLETYGKRCTYKHGTSMR